MSEYLPTVNDYTVGQRVGLHPATDWWMRGARYGKVEGIGRTYVRVRLDATGTVERIHPANLIPVDTAPITNLPDPIPDTNPRGEDDGTLWIVAMETVDGKPYRGTGSPRWESSPHRWVDAVNLAHTVLDMNERLRFAGIRRVLKTGDK